MSSDCHLLAQSSIQEGGRVAHRAEAWELRDAHRDYYPLPPGGGQQEPRVKRPFPTLCPQPDTSQHEALTAVFHHPLRA